MSFSSLLQTYTPSSVVRCRSGIVCMCVCVCVCVCVCTCVCRYICIYMYPKIAKMWILSGQWPSWLATRAGHGPDESAPHQYRWANVVWAPCCRDCVMGCCGGLVVFHWPLVARGSHILHLGLGLLRAHLLGLCCTAAFPLIFLQLRKGPL